MGHVSLQKYPLPDLIPQRPKYYLNSFTHAKLYKKNNKPLIFFDVKRCRKYRLSCKRKRIILSNWQRRCASSS